MPPIIIKILQSYTTIQIHLYIQSYIVRQALVEMKTDYQQLYFSEEFHEITPRIIPSSFGNIYSITAGTPGQPLILVVHGSGPKNSCQQYNFLLQEYLVRISFLQKFYLVAIDCPGYGQSKGSKQAVKTFPLQLFKQILSSLNYKRYYALFGHSQGGSAIFNAVHQDATITQYLVMDRPVCGNIQRFNKFQLPTLLIYDIQDDGHPIGQGKLLYKALKNSQFYTYRNSLHPYWVPDNIWDRMLAFFAKTWGRKTRFIADYSHIKSRSFQKKQSYSLGKSTQKKPFYSIDKVQKIKKQITNKEKLKQIQEIEHSDMMSIADKYFSDESSHSELFEQKIELVQEKQQEIKPVLNEEQIQIINLKISKKIQEQLEKMPLLLQQSKNQQQKTQKLIALQPQTKKQTVLDQCQDYKCPICYQTLYRPVNTNCNHIFCHKCLIQSLLVNDKCPVCRAKITKKTPNQLLQQKINPNMSDKQRERRQKDFQKIQTMMKSIVYIEVGNRSRQLQTKQSIFTKTKKKYIWQVFVKPPREFALQEVGFDINMTGPYAKPIWIKNSPFTFESRGTFSFACQITIHPKNKQYAPLTAIYRINVDPGTHSKIIALRKKCYQK